LWNEKKKLWFTFVSECKCGAQEVKRETAKGRERNVVERKKRRKDTSKEWQNDRKINRWERKEMEKEERKKGDKKNNVKERERWGKEETERLERNKRLRKRKEWERERAEVKISRKSGQGNSSLNQMRF
jgi:hypothetical protein